jgi:hypothetical protein
MMQYGANKVIQNIACDANKEIPRYGIEPE